MLQLDLLHKVFTEAFVCFRAALNSRRVCDCHATDGAPHCNKMTDKPAVMSSDNLGNIHVAVFADID